MKHLKRLFAAAFLLFVIGSGFGGILLFDDTPGYWSYVLWTTLGACCYFIMAYPKKFGEMFNWLGPEEEE